MSSASSSLTAASSTNTTDGGFLDGDIGNGQAGSLTYGIAVSAGILILISTITLASYFCTRDNTTTNSSSSQSQSRIRNRGDHQSSDQTDCTVIEIGIDEETLLTYPKMIYSKAKANDLAGKEDSSSSCCSICLADYISKDVVRLLPDCGHLFHQGCVDPWLRSHPTCPVCRTSPLPTPQSTPLVEVVPLAVNRRN